MYLIPWPVIMVEIIQKIVLFCCRIAQKRSDAVSREILKMYGDDKKMSKKEKDERILWKKNEVG